MKKLAIASLLEATTTTLFFLYSLVPDSASFYPRYARRGALCSLLSAATGRALMRSMLPCSNWSQRAPARSERSSGRISAREQQREKKTKPKTDDDDGRLFLRPLLLLFFLIIKISSLSSTFPTPHSTTGRRPPRRRGHRQDPRHLGPRGLGLRRRPHADLVPLLGLSEGHWRRPQERRRGRGLGPVSVERENERVFLENELCSPLF